MESFYAFTENSNDDDDLEVAAVLANAASKTDEFYALKSGCHSDTTGLRSPIIPDRNVRETASSLSLFDSDESSIYDLAFKGELLNLKHLMNKASYLASNTLVDMGNALLAASNNNWLHVVTYLLNHNVPVNYVDSANATALHYAVSNGNLQMVEFLISKGADINARCKNGNTPLHYAIYCKRVLIADLLLRLNCDITAYNNEMITPSKLMIKSNNKEMQSLLRQHLLQLFK